MGCVCLTWQLHACDHAELLDKFARAVKQFAHSACRVDLPFPLFRQLIIVPLFKMGLTGTSLITSSYTSSLRPALQRVVAQCAVGSVILTLATLCCHSSHWHRCHASGLLHHHHGALQCHICALTAGHRPGADDRQRGVRHPAVPHHRGDPCAADAGHQQTAAVREVEAPAWCAPAETQPTLWHTPSQMCFAGIFSAGCDRVLSPGGTCQSCASAGHHFGDRTVKTPFVQDHGNKSPTLVPCWSGISGDWWWSRALLAGYRGLSGPSTDLNQVCSFPFDRILCSRACSATASQSLRIRMHTQHCCGHAATRNLLGNEDTAAAMPLSVQVGRSDKDAGKLNQPPPDPEQEFIPLSQQCVFDPCPAY